jgi:uncharacterized protein
MSSVINRDTQLQRPVPLPMRENDAKRSRRATFIKWLRKSHGWVGLWAIALTVLFGVTGFLQNHRATIRADAAQISTVHFALPAMRPETPEALAEFLGTEMKIDRPANRIRREPPKRVPWGDRSMMQPERWEVRFIAPEYSISAEYWKGENVVEVRREERGPVGTLEGLHKATGVGLGFLLLSDSVAVSLIFLSLTGMLLWLKLERRRALGVMVFLVSMAASIGLAVQSL